MKRLLVVIDMQKDFIDGALGSKEARAVVSVIKELIRRERESGSTVVFTQDTHGADYAETQEGRLLPVPHCIKGTEGWEISSELTPFASSARIFEKNAFGSIALAEYVQREAFEEIALCGVCTDICVVSNALLIKAFCPEAAVSVMKDACAGTTPQNHAAALVTMQNCQIKTI